MTLPAKSLFHQTDEASRDIIVCLLGFGTGRGEDAGFRNTLRRIPALHERWTYGEAVKAYALQLLIELK